MGTLYYLICDDCKHAHDVGKYEQVPYIITGAYSQHKGHKVRLVTEHEAVDIICDENYVKQEDCKNYYKHYNEDLTGLKEAIKNIKDAVFNDDRWENIIETGKFQPKWMNK